MKLSITERLMTVLATALMATTAHATPQAADTLAPVRTTPVQPVTVVVHDTVCRYIAVPVPAPKSTTDESTKYYTKYEKIRAQRIERWTKLIPNQFTLQYAGSIGMLSAGPGWHYGKKEHWETDILFGFLPRYHSERGKFTFTVKERYVPWHCRFGNQWVLQPLTAGVAFNTHSQAMTSGGTSRTNTLTTTTGSPQKSARSSSSGNAYALTSQVNTAAITRL